MSSLARAAHVEPTSLLVEAFAESVSPATLKFVQGQPVETLTIGTDGLWRIVARGVADVHAALHFNGAALFVVGRPESPVYVDGECVGSDWFEITPPATIEIGTARLDVHSFDTESIYEQTTLPGRDAPIRDFRERSPRTFESSDAESTVMRRGTRALDDEHTTDVIYDMPKVFEALDGSSERPSPRSTLAELEHSGSLNSLRAYDLQRLISEACIDQKAQFSNRAVPSRLRPHELESIDEEHIKLPFWNQLPVLLVTLATFAAVVVGLIWIVWHGDAREPPSALSAASSAPLVTAPNFREAGSTIETLTNDQESSAGPLRAPAIELEERRAIRALWNGDRREALRLYERLAQAHPENSQFREAVRALKRRRR